MVRANDVDHPTVVCIGDSITHGRTSSDYVENAARNVFGRKAYRFVNAGLNGDLAYNVLSAPGGCDCLSAVLDNSSWWDTNDVYAALSTANAHETFGTDLGLPERPTREAFRRYGDRNLPAGVRNARPRQPLKRSCRCPLSGKTRRTMRFK